MQCPICNIDLEPLDLASRTEHVDLCIENGPSVVTIGEDGRATVKKNIPANKVRRVCPICDKTFQNLPMHYKTCALKNDVPPSLMLDQWEAINADLKRPKEFPRSLLDGFVKKCVQEGRVGEQVEFARALSLSMSDNCDEDLVTIDDESSRLSTGSVGGGQAQSGLQQSNNNNAQRQPVAGPLASEILLKQAKKAPTVAQPQKKAKQFRLELVDELTKRANIKLRIERELAATRTRRYLDALVNENTINSDDNGSEIDNNTTKGKLCDDSDSLFSRARLKSCDWSAECRQGRCQDHELRLLVDGFAIYSGRSIDATPRKGHFGAVERPASCEGSAAAEATGCCEASAAGATTSGQVAPKAAGRPSDGAEP